ncbi:MAG: efflux RND transporter periplasmic adaptor subunit [Anaerolineae bacterium]
MGKGFGLRWLWIVMAIMAGALAACQRVGGVQEEATPTPIPTAVVPSKPTYTVARGEISEEVKFTGRIAPVTEEQLFFRMDGLVAKVNVKQGDKVAKGDVLAELEMADLTNALAQAQVSLQTAELQLKASAASTAEQRTRAQVALDQAKHRLAQAQIQDPTPNLKIAKINRDRAAIAVQLAQDAWNQRARFPGVEGSGEALNLQQATLDYEAAQASYELAEQAARVHELTIKILEGDVRLAQLELNKTQEEVDPVMAQEVARAKLEVQRLTKLVEDGRLTAPFDGEVTMMGAYAGRSVSAYRPAISIAAPGALEISVDLTNETMQKLSIGQECSITMVNYPAKEFHGTVRRLPYPYGTGGSSTAGTAEEDRSTRITIDDADVTLEKGALVRVRVVLQRKDNVLWLPPAAIRTFQGKDFVLVVDGEGQRRVPVKLGIKGEDRVEIVDGLEEGQVVVGP